MHSPPQPGVVVTPHRQDAPHSYELTEQLTALPTAQSHPFAAGLQPWRSASIAQQDQQLQV